MTWEREQQIARLRAELALLEQQEATERSMRESGWIPMGNGAYRVPGCIQRYRLKT